MSILNERIRERRISMGKTLLEIAESIGVKEATMQRYESGQIKNIKHETISAIADALKCTPSYLMGWSDKPSSAPSPTESEAKRCFEALSEAHKAEALNFLRYLATREDRE